MGAGHQGPSYSRTLQTLSFATTWESSGRSVSTTQSHKGPLLRDSTVARGRLRGTEVSVSVWSSEELRAARKQPVGWRQSSVRGVHGTDSVFHWKNKSQKYSRLCRCAQNGLDTATRVSRLTGALSFWTSQGHFPSRVPCVLSFCSIKWGMGTSTSYANTDQPVPLSFSWSE